MQVPLTFKTQSALGLENDGTKGLPTNAAIYFHMSCTCIKTESLQQMRVFTKPGGFLITLRTVFEGLKEVQVDPSGKCYRKT